MNPLYQRERPAYHDTVWEQGCGLIWMRGETLFFDNPRNRFMRFRRRFRLDFEPQKAELRIFTDTFYQLWVNGRACGRGPARSDFTCAYFDRSEVAPQLRRGENCIAVLALFQGFGTGRGISIMQGLLFQLTVAGANGERAVIVSDPQWRAAPAEEFLRPTPRLHGPLGCIEVQDTRLGQPGWELPDFDDSDWAQCDYIKSDLRVIPWYAFMPSPVPMRREGRWSTLAAVRTGYADYAVPPVECIGEPRPRPVASGAKEAGAALPCVLPTEAPAALPCVLPCGGVSGRAQIVTLDFARIENGLLELEVEAAAGTVIDALFSDSLAPGDVIPKPKQARMLSARWILRGGRQRLQVAFNWLAFRYVQLWVWAEAEVVLHGASIRTLYYPLPEDGAGFRCSDPFLSWLDGICSHTVRLCYQDAIVDSPSREQQQWIGDARKTAVFNHHRWGDAVLHRNLIEQIGQGMDWAGTMVARHPSGNHNITPIPSYCLDWIGAFEDYFFYTGDDSLLPVWWPNILLSVRWFSAFERRADGLLENVPYWLYIDIGADAQGRRMATGEVLTSLNLQYLAALRTVAACARRLGESGSEAWFRTKAERLERAIRETLWSETAEVYVDALSAKRLPTGAPSAVQQSAGAPSAERQPTGVLSAGQLSSGASEVTAALALLHLEEPGSERANALVRRVFLQPDDAVVRCSPFSVTLVLDALVKHGQAQTALELIRDRYRPLQEAGATATWEHWHVFEEGGAELGGYPLCASACHAWGAAPMAFFTGVVLGIRPLAPGWSEVEIRPFASDLCHAGGSCLTPQGRITVNWEMRDGVFRMEVDAPQSVRGRIVLPDGSARPLVAGCFEALVGAGRRS